MIDTCNKDSEAMNLYQMTYIVEASVPFTPTIPA